MKNLIYSISLLIVLNMLNVFSIFADNAKNNITNNIALRHIDDPIVTQEDEKIEQQKIYSKDTQDLINKIKKINTLSADFTQTEQDLNNQSNKKLDNIITNSNTIKGTVKLSKPNKLLWDIKSPSSEQQVYVTNGSKFWHYDKSLEQVVLDDFDSQKITNSPLYFLLSDVDIVAEQYNIYKVSNNSFRLIAKQKANFDNNYISNLQLYFNNKSDKIEKLEFIAAKHKKIIINLDNLRVNSGVSSASFDFRAPRGVDIIKASELY